MKNAFVEKFIAENHLQILQSDEWKPWWAYYVTHEIPEYDEKILWIKPGEFLSLQYHGNLSHPGHAEKGIAITDMALVLWKTDVSALPIEEIYETHVSELDIIFIPKWWQFSTPAGHLHAYINPFQHDVYLTEVRTSQIREWSNEREKNITRVYDTTGRNGIPPWPKWLLEKISNTVH